MQTMAPGKKSTKAEKSNVKKTPGKKTPVKKTTVEKVSAKRTLPSRGHDLEYFSTAVKGTLYI